jgi:phospholipid/cholesterol/gamma-HCH transport system ATP-binding protein
MSNFVIADPTSANHAADQNPCYIEFKNVSKAFGDNHVLRNVSFEVNPAETVCILGRSGVGKSVALQNIMGFLKPDSGRVIVAHEDITDYSEEELERIRKKVTMVFQSGALFDSLTVGENVAFPLRERNDLSEEQILQIVSGLLEMVGVKNMADQFPAELSTGMKRSVAIARARLRALRRADHDGRSAYGAIARRSHEAAQTSTSSHERGGYTRHAAGKKTRGPRRVFV